MENIKYYTCQECKRANRYNLSDKITICYHCENHYKIVGDKLILSNPINNNTPPSSSNTNKKTSSDTTGNAIGYGVLALFGIAVVCYILSYFFDKKPANSNTSYTPPTEQLRISKPTYNTDSIINKEQPTETVFKNYNGKYTIDKNGNLQSDAFILQVSSNQITYTKNGNLKVFDVVYQGIYEREVQPGMKFKYHQFYFTNKKVYILISDHKEVKHLGEFYYRIIIDGQTQLAL